jgi:hypothetical protein
MTNDSVFIYHIHIHVPVKPHLSRARQAAMAMTELGLMDLIGCAGDFLLIPGI